MQKRGMRFFALALNLVLLLGILAACSSGTPPSKNPTNTVNNGTITVKIAADLPISGVDAASGRAIENSVRMAIDEANSSNFLPGYTLVFDSQNNVGASNRADPAIGAQNVTMSLNDAEVAGVIGPFNGDVAQDELPLTNVAPLAEIGPTSASECLTRNAIDTSCTGPNDLLSKLRPTKKITFFRVAAPNSDQGSVGADYAHKTLGDKSAFVIDDQTLDGVGLANAFIAEYQIDGGMILGRDSLPATTNYAQELAKIAQLRPAMIYFAGSASSDGLALRKQILNTPGLEQTVLMGGDGLNTSAFAAAHGATSGGPVYSTVGIVDASKNPAAASFIKAYEASYGSPGLYSASSYDSAEILLNAIKAAIQNGARVPANSSDIDTARAFRQAVINQIALTSYNGLTGQLSFDANGDPAIRTITIYQLTTIDGSPGWKYVTAENPT